MAVDVSVGSVTALLQQLRDGEASAAQQALWERYFQRLAGIARLKLAPATRRARDEEDIALSALDSFFQASAEGRYPELGDRTELWPLLAQIAVCKALAHRQHELATKRGAGAVRGDSAVDELPWSASIDLKAGFDRFLSSEPTPDSLAELNELVCILMRKLDNATLRKVAQLKMAGHSNREIADELEVSERTVERKLVRIRTLLAQLADA
jgi:DNA-directed RNA polymerase specialized sigma24 family protein